MDTSSEPTIVPLLCQIYLALGTTWSRSIIWGSSYPRSRSTWVTSCFIFASKVPRRSAKVTFPSMVTSSTWRPLGCPSCWNRNTFFFLSKYWFFWMDTPSAARAFSITLILDGSVAIWYFGEFPSTLFIGIAIPDMPTVFRLRTARGRSTPAASPFWATMVNPS